MAVRKVLQERGEFRRESAGFQTEVEEVANPKKRALEGWKYKVHLYPKRKSCEYNYRQMRKSRKNTPRSCKYFR